MIHLCHDTTDFGRREETEGLVEPKAPVDIEPLLITYAE
jgi:hypothetical protein